MNEYTNIYRAINEKTGQIEYLVGRYDEKNGQYTRSLSQQERRDTGCSAEFGSFGYVRQYTNESSARSAARRQDGYSKIENAYGNIGDGFDRI